VEKKFALVRPRSQTRALMVSHYEKRALSIPDAKLSLAQPVAGGIYMLAFESAALGRPLLVNVVESNGRMLVDWETCSLFQEIFLEEIRKTRPLTPVPLAVRAERDSYYNFGFTEDKFTCYRLIYPNLNVDLFGYTRKDSREDVTLAALAQPFTAGERPVTAILEVKYPSANAAPNQVEIVKIAHESWVND
jgi:hypothetical protein